MIKLDRLSNYFSQYSEHTAPFMHQQRREWAISQPLKGLRVLHHVPVVANTVLKIVCLLEAGAIITVTNPSSFMTADKTTVEDLQQAGIRYAEDLDSLKNEEFDIYFDCGAQLYQALGNPKIGAIELTGSGDHYYRQQSLNFPVISIDPTLTKQLETVFGCAESCHAALLQLTNVNPSQKSWLVFGFGKIGRGLAYFCVQHHAMVTVVDSCEKQRAAATALGIVAIDPNDLGELQKALNKVDIVVTATGKKSIMEQYPRHWFKGKILGNMGVYDEYGPNFAKEEVLNSKEPLNFVLNDPTPMQYIDPEFYIHNIAALFFENDLKNGVNELPEQVDREIVSRWCEYHSFPYNIISQWFMLQEKSKP